MIGQLEKLKEKIQNCEYELDIHVPNFTAVMKEDELCKIIGKYDAWIIGDDPCSEKVIAAGKNGKLKALVKWGVGVDNVNFEACKKYGIPVTNTPAMFGEEVSDIAINYLLTLTRETHLINVKVREGEWYKPAGRTLTGRKVALIGFGDIGRCVARKCLAFNLDVNVSDPGFFHDMNENGKIKCKYDKELKIPDNIQKVTICNNLQEAVDKCDYIIVTCSLNKHTNKMVNKEIIKLGNKGVIIINVARGPIVVEDDVIELLNEGYIKSVGFDVFEEEPLSNNSKLLDYEQNIYGSHNGSNTIDAVLKTSIIALEKLITNYEIWCDIQQSAQYWEKCSED
tara:strand:+ start:3389 stop:4405 length:1017 start_codon:yes stop_codon:yes gene_type:complete